MKNVTILLVFFFFCLIQAFSQNKKMNIIHSDYSTEFISIDDISGMYFSNIPDGGTLTVKCISNQEHVYQLNDVRSISFSPFGMLSLPLIIYTGQICDTVELDEITEITFSELITGIDEQKLPDEHTLFCSPNPFDKSIKFILPNNLTGNLEIYNLQGVLISIVENPNNRELIDWNPIDSNGLPVSPGVYFVKASSGNSFKTAFIVYQP